MLDEVKVCVGYVGEDGAKYDHVPYHQSVLHKVKPVYETFPGWKTEVGEARTLDALPSEARDFVRFVEEFAGRAVRVRDGRPRTRADHHAACVTAHPRRARSCDAGLRREGPRRRLRRARARARRGRCSVSTSSTRCTRRPATPGIAADGVTCHPLDANDPAAVAALAASSPSTSWCRRPTASS